MKRRADKCVSIGLLTRQMNGGPGLGEERREVGWRSSCQELASEPSIDAESAPVESWAREAGSLLRAASPAQDLVASRERKPFGPDVVLTESRSPHVRARCQDGKIPQSCPWTRPTVWGHRLVS